MSKPCEPTQARNSRLRKEGGHNRIYLQAPAKWQVLVETSLAADRTPLPETMCWRISPTGFLPSSTLPRFGVVLSDNVHVYRLAIVIRPA